jgi:hypothetical protein
VAQEPNGSGKRVLPPKEGKREGNVSGVRKLRSFAPEEFKSPANLWEVLVRGRKDTFLIHTALRLFKNARGYRGLFTEVTSGAEIAKC